MHKQIHYERTLSMDELLNDGRMVLVQYVDPRTDKPTGEYREVECTITGIFKEVKRTWKSENDHYDVDSPFAHIPIAFQTNRMMLMFITMQMEISRGVYNPNLDKGFMCDSTEMLKLIKPRNDIEAIMLSTFLHEYWAMYSFWNNNERIYKVTTGLMNGLMDTNYPAMGDMVRSPHESLFLLLPVENPFVLPTVPEAIARNIGTDRPMEGAYVSLHRNVKGKGEGGRLTEGSILSCYLVERPRSMNDIMEPESHYFNLLIPDHWKLDRVVDEGVEKLHGTTVADEFAQMEFDITGQLKPIVKMIINSLLYMTSTNAEVIPMNAPKETNPTDKRIRKYPHRVKSRKAFNQLGADIVISRTKHQHVNNGARGTGSKHSYRYEVRGHFSHYWMREDTVADSGISDDKISGEKTDEFGVKWYRVRKWLDRFMKGSEIAEVILKDYRLEE